MSLSPCVAPSILAKFWWQESRLMQRYLLLRFVFSIWALFVVASLVFGILRLTGDPIKMFIPSGVGPEQAAQFRHELGFDRPLHVQYLKFLVGVVTLNMGTAFRYKEPAMGLVLERMPATLTLAISALAIAFITGIPLGALAAVYRNSPLDSLVSLLAFFGYATPQFWLGIMLMLMFAVRLGWLPTSGTGSLRHLILPAITLASWPLGQVTRLTRSEMLEVLHRDYVRTARAKGLPEWRVLFGHALRNAAIPLVTLAGLNLGAFLGGAILVENVFAWPGVGRLAVQAISFRDFPLVQASVIVIAVSLVMINFFVDIVYVVLDPRVKLQ